MLCGGVPACHRYGVCTVHCVEWELSGTQHSAQYTHYTYEKLPHHLITYNDVSRKCVIPVVCVKLGKWYVVKHNCVT